jgi:hypothetical protein
LFFLYGKRSLYLKRCKDRKKKYISLNLVVQKNNGTKNLDY